MLYDLIAVLNLILILVLVALVLFRDRQIQNKKTRHIKQQSEKSWPSHTNLDSQALDNRLLKQADDAVKFTQTFQKFVPKQFLAHFTRSGFDSIQLGQAIEADVSILFCDIRGFTTLAEKMPPKDLITFLNSYFYRMNDPIHENGGFIDKFIGDAIMALFDRPDSEQANNAYDAIKASSELYRALELYNSHRKKTGYDPVRIGVGVHHGSVVIGTVGSEDRMDTTVIGDAVNVAERVEKLSAVYEVDILVTDDLLERALEKGRFAYRFVDRLKVRGREKSLDVYEILEHLASDVIQQKLEVARLIQSGVKHRLKSEWDLAIKEFEQAISMNPDDRLAFYHLKRCIEIKNSHIEMADINTL
ncbi:adenylate/guanylate cyclase domain-containing protein [Glaciecola sp. 1036]|uniref:adenylate/guanylate cyclase domain-containing protein n=1 Tax=Alteromonadaceae TaxID=72275 RepID=UPI003D056192